MNESLESIAREVLASHYGIQQATIRPIGHGLINWLARVEGGDRSGVLKRYNPALFEPWNVELSVQAQHHCFTRGAPVPALVPNRAGELVTWSSDVAYVLSEWAEGRHPRPGSYPAAAARSLGQAVGRIVVALGGDWRDLREPWTLPKPAEVIDRFERVLAAAESGTAELDRRTARDVRFRMAYLNRHPDLYARVSAVPMQWIHCDFIESNVLIADDDTVSAVVDFDNTTVLPRGVDFMRALAYCITPTAPERDDYLRGYLDVARPSRDELSTYVPVWTYLAVGDAWPLEIRYLEPERFDPRWEEASRVAFLADDWEATMENVASWLVRE